MIFNAKHPKQEGEQSAALFLQRAERICIGLLKAIAFVGGAGVFLLGVSLIAARADIWLGWFLTLAPFVVWKICWICSWISWLFQKIWDLCCTIFRYIHKRKWTAIAFWAAIIWCDRCFGGAAFVISTCFVGSPNSKWIGRFLAKYGIQLVPGCCCPHHFRKR